MGLGVATSHKIFESLNCLKTLPPAAADSTEWSKRRSKLEDREKIVFRVAGKHNRFSLR